MSATIDLQIIPLKTVVANPTAVASAGTTMTFSPGLYKCIVKPSGGNITVKIGAASTTITVTDGTWSPFIYFEPVVGTSPTIKLIGSNIGCDLVAYFCTRICPTATIS